LLSLEHISIQFGERVLFKDLSLIIGPHDRIGLVGSNGTGKSTLLKIVAGIIQADAGSLKKARYVTVGYLPQDGMVSSGRSLYHEAETAFDDILEVRQEMEDAHAQMTSNRPESEAYKDALEVFGELQHKLEDLDAFRMKSKIERVLMGLGFSIHDLTRQTEEFSGGWQMRIALAKLLLKEPSVLLLDEPTNHLDIESLMWLEEYLEHYNGAVILVSHDRTFLDSLTLKTVALGAVRPEFYSGNYSFYEKERKLRREQQINAFKNQQKHLEQTQKFIERFRYKATKARQVQSRIKQLEKIEVVEIEGKEEEIHFSFPPPPVSGAVVMELRNLSKRYGDLLVFENLNFSVVRGDRTAVVGVNGAGKSTMSKILAGIEPFQKGERISGHNVSLSYYAQHQAEELDLSKTVLQTVDEVATGEIRTKLRTILGAFLFHGDDVFKSVSVLSGGEKSRLALAKMLLKPANFLIMDEPTNHLDMRSKKILQDALSKYEGTYLIVSHDRSFLDPIINKVAEVGPSGVRTLPGSVSEYLEKLKSEKNAAEEVGRAPGLRPDAGDKERKRLEAENRQRLYKKLRPVKLRLEKIEAEISLMEGRKNQIEKIMGDAEFYKNGEEARRTALEYRELQTALDRAYTSWSDTAGEIAAIEYGKKDAPVTVYPKTGKMKGSGHDEKK